jgi:hypothetical protein|eukprot:SAG31_NODE_4858_length_2903_cov_1.542439_3_plen_103_part_00
MCSVRLFVVGADAVTTIAPPSTVKWWEKCGGEIESQGSGYGYGYGYGGRRRLDEVPARIWESKYLLCGGSRSTSKPHGIAPDGSPCEGGENMYTGFVRVSYR